MSVPWRFAFLVPAIHCNVIHGTSVYFVEPLPDLSLMVVNSCPGAVACDW